MESFEKNKTVENFPSFDDQFENRQFYDLLGGKVEYVDIRPEKLKSEIPVVIAPGWGETIDSFKDTMHEWFLLGWRVITLNHPRDGEDVSENTEGVSKTELRKALALISLLEEKGLDKVEMMAHSEGGINAAIAGTMETNKFSKIAFVNVGGLIGKDSFVQLASRFNFSLMQEAYMAFKNPERRDGAWTNTKELVSYIAQNPIRALKEAVSISEAETEDMLNELHEHGVGVIVINGVDDTVFPMDKMQQIVKKDHLDGFLSVKGGHNEITLNPKKYVGAINEMFEKLDLKNNKEESEN